MKRELKAVLKVESVGGNQSFAKIGAIRYLIFRFFDFRFSISRFSVFRFLLHFALLALHFPLLGR